MSTEEQDTKFKVEPDLEKLKKMEIPTRRVRIMMMTPGHFMALFTKGLVWRKRTKLIEGVPEDAKLLTMTYDTPRQSVVLVVESSEYEPVPINEHPPIQPIEIQTLFGGTKAPKKARKK